MEPNAAPLAIPSIRNPTPTLPFDLSEYARVETGPESWSAALDDASLAAWAVDDDGHAARTTEVLVTISPSDIPRVTKRPEPLARLSLCEAFVLDSIDGETSVEGLLEALDMPLGEALTILCELCASGAIVLDA